MRAIFLVYEKDGVSGNDLCSGVDIFAWLNEKRAKYPESEIAITNWKDIEIGQHVIASVMSNFGMDYEESKSRIIDPEPVEEPEAPEVEPEVPEPEPEVEVVEESEVEVVEAPDPESVKPSGDTPRGWYFRKEFIDSEGKKFVKGVYQPE